MSISKTPSTGFMAPLKSRCEKDAMYLLAVWILQNVNGQLSLLGHRIQLHAGMC